ncbi:MAG: hypothetical protein OCC45_08180 [Desulfotalea sp.]
MKNTNYIKAHMLLNDVSAKDIAKMAPPSTPSQVHGVIRGDRPTAYIRKVIAKAINKTVCEIWPV